MRSRFVIALLAIIAEAVIAQTTLPPETRLAIHVEGTDYDLDARVYRPTGKGPFPLVVINHGTPPDRTKLPSTTLGFVRGARWFADRGFIVVVALRPGYGSSTGDYLESAGTCRSANFVAGGRKTAAIESAIIASASRLPDVDANRIIIVGQSAGGFGAVALADNPPPGVIGVISFAGGRGSDGHEHICAGEDKLVAAEKTFGANNRLPQLWLYAANDHYFRPALARRMVDAYSGASTPRIAFVDLPAFGDDGHKTFSQADPSVWATPVSNFLASVLKP